MKRMLIFAGLLLLALAPARGQEKSVRPGINDLFKNPDVKGFLEKFETESREIFTQRKEIVAACKVKPGMAVADIGAGTGLFTRLLAQEVGPNGKVYAVEIAQSFLDHIANTCKAQKLSNVELVKCDQVSCNLPANSIDLVFICDTYHHFEFPYKTMASIHQALKPGGQVVVIDFKRIKRVSTDWVMKHVRAGQGVFTQEIRDSGFDQVEELKLLKENYYVRFVKRAKGKNAQK